MLKCTGLLFMLELHYLTIFTKINTATQVRLFFD
jgi:hypothetical protein